MSKYVRFGSHTLFPLCVPNLKFWDANNGELLFRAFQARVNVILKMKRHFCRKHMPIASQIFTLFRIVDLH
jgi:hypothetical protein